MSYVSNDSSLWFNLAGVVAAYQPVRAPGPLLARYNMAYGGNNKYKLGVVGTLPTFNPVVGWIFDSDNDDFTLGIPAYSNWTAILRYSNSTVDYGEAHFWSSTYSTPIFMVGGRYTATNVMYRYGNKSVSMNVGNSTSGIQGLAANLCYWNGRLIYTISGATFSAATAGNLGFKISRTTPRFYLQSAAIYTRTLSAAEMWTASLQMAYCDVNPDWSAWGRRRQWYYYSTTAGAVRILPNKYGVVGLGDSGVSIRSQGTVNL